MAALNKLAIRGIRSFDDKHIQVIEFYSPLTVIVGHNGSGKTTIIECLKYATTGDLPPNTKGGAFVHDPKIANEKEVKAQVRLRFWNVNRQRMTATRNLQVTVKKGGGLTMKTLEGVLAKSDADGGDGKRNTISTKCSEMDEEVPLLLGVSRAILENVIFCHQEESNWPLSEPAALKKKFDDIFEATKYTKALDNIKLLRKEITQELKVDKERLTHLKSDKDKAERMRVDIEEADKTLTSKEALVERLKTQFEDLKAENVQSYAEATGFNTIFERYESLKEKKAMYVSNSENALEAMQVMGETTPELEHMKNNFEAHTATLNAKREAQAAAVKRENEAIAGLRSREKTLVSVQGGLQANKRTYERNVREREAAIREVANTHNYAGYDYSPLEDHKVTEFVDKIHELVRKAEADLRKIKDDGSRKEKAIQAELDRLAGTKATAIATKKSKQEQIMSLNNKIRHAEGQYDSVSSFDVEIELLEAKIAEVTEAQHRLETDLREAKYDEQIRDRAAAIRQNEGERDKVQAELAVLNRQADSRAQLSIKRNELKNKEGSMQASLTSHAARFKELVGSDIAAQTMEELIGTAIGKKDRELQEAEAAASASNRTLSQLQTSVNIAKQTLKSKRDELARLEKAIADALAEGEKTTIKEALEEASAEVEDRTNTLTNRESIAEFWKRILTNCKSKHKCMGCDRDIPAGDSKTIEKYLQTQITRFSSSAGKAEIEEEKAQWQAEYDKFQSLLPSEYTITELRTTTIPHLDDQIKTDSAKIDQAAESVEENKAKVQRAKMAARDLGTLKAAASLIARTVADVKDLKVDIGRLERDLEASGSLKTVEDVQAEVDALGNAIKNLQREQAGFSAEKELKSNNLRSQSDDLNRKNLRLGELKNQQEKRKRDEAVLREMQETLAALQAELKDLDAAAKGAEAPWNEKQAQLTRYQNDRLNAENDASMQVGIYQSSLNEIEGKHKACQAYIVDGNDRKIRENDSALEDLRIEIEHSDASRQQQESLLQIARDELAKADSLKSNINANLNYRNSLSAIEKVQEEIEAIDIDSAAKSRKQFNARYKVQLEEENNLLGKLQMENGRLMEMRENTKKHKSTLKSDYQNIDQLFKDQLIKTKVREHANNDLDKYGKALDNAILKYHAIKMDEINDTIGHLWSKTYQGTDIDTIRIVSDHDESGSTTTRKSYNYRVVMVKNDVELDMRGRCSAGQKVLASIIIRLALAESFGQGCGVLALDEPTTNLDQENINALAEALAEIIRERRRQTNFQLIVITHDEGFLQRLAAHDVLEYYWRVSRDGSQKSTLERQRVAM